MREGFIFSLLLITVFNYTISIPSATSQLGSIPQPPSQSFNNPSSSYYPLFYLPPYQFYQSKLKNHAVFIRFGSGTMLNKLPKVIIIQGQQGESINVMSIPNNYVPNSEKDHIDSQQSIGDKPLHEKPMFQYQLIQNSTAINSSDYDSKGLNKTTQFQAKSNFLHSSPYFIIVNASNSNSSKQQVNLHHLSMHSYISQLQIAKEMPEQTLSKQPSVDILVTRDGVLEGKQNRWKWGAGWNGTTCAFATLQEKQCLNSSSSCLSLTSLHFSPISPLVHSTVLLQLPFLEFSALKSFSFHHSINQSLMLISKDRLLFLRSIGNQWSVGHINKGADEGFIIDQHSYAVIKNSKLEVYQFEQVNPKLKNKPTQKCLSSLEIQNKSKLTPFIQHEMLVACASKCIAINLLNCAIIDFPSASVSWRQSREISSQPSQRVALIGQDRIFMLGEQKVSHFVPYSEEIYRNHSRLHDYELDAALAPLLSQFTMNPHRLPQMIPNCYLNYTSSDNKSVESLVINRTLSSWSGCILNLEADSTYRLDIPDHPNISILYCGSPKNREKVQCSSRGHRANSEDSPKIKYAQKLIASGLLPNSSKSSQNNSKTNENIAHSPTLSLFSKQVSEQLKQSKQYAPILFLSNHNYRIYVLPIANASNILALTLHDLQKEELEFATSIFFMIMIILSIVLTLLICSVMLRKFIVGALIYFGLIENHRREEYPLSWMALKIKLKSMQRLGYLKYKQKPSTSKGEASEIMDGIETTSEDSTCCFCLQEMKVECQIAELYCRHQFHKDCFESWIQNQINAKCPNCRRAFNPKSMEDFLNSDILFRAQ